MPFGDFLDLSQSAARSARFTITGEDLTRAKERINEGYLSTCASADEWDFTEVEETWSATGGTDLYTYTAIETSMALTGSSIAAIVSMVNDSDGIPMRHVPWVQLERLAHSTQDDSTVGQPDLWSTFNRQLRLYPKPTSNTTIRTLLRVAPNAMSADADVPVIPLAWRHRVLVPYAAWKLLATEGGAEARAEANVYREEYQEAFRDLRTAHATAKRPDFSLVSPNFDLERPADPYWWTR